VDDVDAFFRYELLDPPLCLTARFGFFLGRLIQGDFVYGYLRGLVGHPAASSQGEQTPGE
jgi:hypothetical protein